MYFIANSIQGLEKWGRSKNNVTNYIKDPRGIPGPKLCGGGCGEDGATERGCFPSFKAAAMFPCPGFLKHTSKMISSSLRVSRNSKSRSRRCESSNSSKALEELRASEDSGWPRRLGAGWPNVHLGLQGKEAEVLGTLYSQY